ncbi:mismatch-specific DNA-glycosylase [Ammoniphilus sp. 3BR4]|uniref:mismatch-specific DNA-glycosylase n=1 Tax=Ammoniphilus sp. 3BR4 TaxID=3158265 RepID=UPI0034666C6C
MHEIPDHLREGLLILFVGYNPSLRSGQTGHHYANPNNRFWTILHRSGLTPRKYKPEEDLELLELGYGFTNIVARPTRTAAEITKEEYIEGKELLKQKILKYKPRVVTFVGKGVYEQYSGRRNFSWGIQQPPILRDVVEFVGPSSSGLVRMKIEEVIDIYRGLYDLVASVKN